jgi:hypothetical protein
VSTSHERITGVRANESAVEAMDVWVAVRTAATVGLIALAIGRGFCVAPGGVLSWPMFSSIAFTRVDLASDKDGTVVNPWAYRIHCDVAGGMSELESMLEYLAAVHGLTVSGRGVLVSSEGRFPLVVVASSVEPAPAEW